MPRRVRKRIKQLKFSSRMKRKLALLFIIIALALIAIIARIVYIQVVNGDKYTKTVLGQQEYSTQTIPFKRGDITDRKGTVLATSTEVYNVILDCKVLTSSEKYIEPTIDALSDCFDVTKKKLKKILKKYPNSQYYVLKKELTYSQIQEFQEILDDDENHPYVGGVWFEKEYERQYPYSTLASGVVGFTTSGNEGISGLENYYNSMLNGVDGRKYGYLEEGSEDTTTIVEAQDGNTLVTTLDVNIQSIVEEKIKAFNKKYSSGTSDGSANTAAIVMDPNSGEVLAMASYPDYDLNNPWDLSEYYSEDEIENMSDKKKLKVLNSIWQNFCITTTYEPGSTMKPFTVATGLETGTMSGNESYVCNGYEKIGGFTIHCVNRNGHGTLNVKEALMESCNDALMQMSYSIGKDNLSKYQNIFGFGLKTSIDLPGEARTDTLVYSADDMSLTTMATNSFGQNINVTMIQMACGFSSLINGGNYYQPHIVSKIVDENGDTVSKNEPTLLKQTISEDTSNKIKEYLRAVVKDGTGSDAGVKGYDIGGKTGTAQKYPRGNGNYLVSFIGYAPQDDPQVVVYVIVDEPNVADQAHSSYAQEIAHGIFKEVLPYMNISKVKD